MTDCNATLNGMKCGKYGHPDGTLHRHKHEPAADWGCYAAWTDGFPEAKPHVEPELTVTDAEPDQYDRTADAAEEPAPDNPCHNREPGHTMTTALSPIRGPLVPSDGWVHIPRDIAHALIRAYGSVSAGRTFFMDATVFTEWELEEAGLTIRMEDIHPWVPSGSDRAEPSEMEYVTAIRYRVSRSCPEGVDRGCDDESCAVTSYGYRHKEQS